MPYRTPPPDDRAHIVDLARHSEIVVDNGTVTRISIPCSYGREHHVHDPRRHRMAHDHLGWPSPDHPDESCQLPSTRPFNHVTLDPIDLEGEGYSYVDVGMVAPPDGLTFEGYIDYDTIELVVNTHCPDAQTESWDVPYAVYVGGMTVDERDNETEVELRDVVTKGVLHIVKGPYETVEPGPGPSPDPTPVVPEGSIGTDELADGSVTRGKLDPSLLSEIEDPVGNDDIEDSAVSWDKLDQTTRDNISATHTKIQATSGGVTAKLEAGVQSGTQTLKLDGRSVYMTHGIRLQGDDPAVPSQGRYTTPKISYGHTYVSRPTIVVGLYSTSTSDEIGSVNVAVTEWDTTGFKVTYFNNSSTARNPGFTWIAIG